MKAAPTKCGSRFVLVAGVAGRVRTVWHRPYKIMRTFNFIHNMLVFVLTFTRIGDILSKE